MIAQTSKERKQEAAIAEIFVRVRYFVKATKTVIYDVQSGPSQYRVCLNENGTATCTCEGNATWHKTCKHIKAMRRIEASRVQEQESATVGAVITQANEAITADIEAAAVAGDKSYAEVVGYGSGKATYGLCGHLSKNENDDCGACKSKAWR